ncbi:hypothetical protein GCM10008956_00150 [Deinococcus arenae]|uniref:Uncharacterized protein n=1 Tax=Deinococcus arenae TaxID=1452751 RepID=A0A8H9GKV9_9DEIO|nr:MULTISPECIES: hypothetical protein [Deinococcus]GGM28082.1 hypothetical protein GCM10008956_00150 [Deinococcus arenae]
MRWRWLLGPLLGLALLAPRAECPVRPLIAPPGVTDAAALRVPPLRPGDRLAPLGTDRFGRDAACVLPRALRRSLGLALWALAWGALPGVLLGLWRGWRGALSWPPELPALLLAALLLGRGSFRLVLAGGAALLTARLVAAQVAAVRQEAFVEGAAALGGGAAHVLRAHVWPHLRPRLGAVLGTVLSGVFLWLMELGVLGFHDQPTLTVAFTDSLDAVPDVTAVPLNADLGQLISFARWTWLDTPEGLAWPALLLTLLVLALKDAARATSGPRTRAGSGPRTPAARR